MTIKRPILATTITLAVIAAVFLIAPQFYGNRSLLLSILTFVALAQGLNLLYGFTGYLPFGYVGFFGAGAYATSLLVLHTGIPVLGCVVLGGVTAVLVGLILGPLLRLSGPYFSIANLAASQVLFNVVSNQDLASITGGPYGLKIDKVYDLPMAYLAMLAVALIATALAAYLRFSRFGLGMRAMKQMKPARPWRESTSYADG